VRALAGLALLVAFAAAGCGGGSGDNAAPMQQQTTSRFRGTELSPVRKSPDFTLRDQDGKTVSLSALRGKTVLLTFLYVHCPDVCPLIADNLDIVLRKLGPGRANVRAVAVSVDPKGDDPKSVRNFIGAHHLVPQFRYLTGTHAQLAPIWKAYHIAAMATPEHTVDHSAYTMLIDRDGNQRVLYDAQVKAAQVLHDLRELDVAK
jgi:protein SCO1